MSSKPALSQEKPRLSASLVVVNAQNEVLLVQRNPKASSFAGAHVFPGGNYDAKQDNSLHTTAIRETFEETGLLVATSSSSRTFPSDAELDRARVAIHSQHQSFQEFLENNDISLDAKSLLPFTQWITPLGQPRRFQTQFYLTFLNDTLAKGFTSGQKQDRLPTSDGGLEVISARFIHPKHAIEEFKARKSSFFPPQFYILTTLANILEGPSNTPGQREKIHQLSSGPFGQMIVQPMAALEKDPEGRVVMTYEGDETRGGPPGRRHRSYFKVAKGGLPIFVELQRNFDIFTEIEAAKSSKL